MIQMLPEWDENYSFISKYIFSEIYTLKTPQQVIHGCGLYMGDYNTRVSYPQFCLCTMQTWIDSLNQVKQFKYVWIK